MTERDAEAAVLSFRFSPTALTATRAARAKSAYMASGDPPPAMGPCDVPNRDGTRCHNPGRHPVSQGSREGWSCTTHYKMLTRAGRA
jgi:hypothetical protein